MLFFIRHDRRELIQFNVTSSPTAAWVWQQLIEATPWARQPKYLIHDRDAVYGRTFGARLANLVIASVPTPVRAPRASAIAERLVRTLRSEALDHIIVLNDSTVAPFSLSSSRTTTAIVPTGASALRARCLEAQNAFGTVVRQPVLGGLHHAYARVA